jgi:hypothetical protein
LHWRPIMGLNEESWHKLARLAVSVSAAFGGTGESLFAMVTAVSLCACSVPEARSNNLTAGRAGPITSSDSGQAVDRATMTESACDPLAPKALALGAIVGVGQDANGTLYVDAENGIFVSDGNRLLRQHVNGTGQSGNDEFIFTFEAPGDDETSARNLLVDTQGSSAIAMALGPSNSKSFLGQSSAGTTPLTIVDASAVSEMQVLDTASLISYVGDVANGDVLLATIPMNRDSNSEDGGLRIFYGPPQAVAERTLTSFEESLSGNGTLTFLVDNVPFVLAFGFVQGTDAGPLGTFTLEGLTARAGSQLAVTLRTPTPTVIPANLSLTCQP